MRKSVEICSSTSVKKDRLHRERSFHLGPQSIRHRGFFPDEWKKQIHAGRPNWFDEYSVDAAGEHEPYRIRDNVKSDVGAQLMNWADELEDLRWASRWMNLPKLLMRHCHASERTR